MLSNTQKNYQKYRSIPLVFTFCKVYTKVDQNDGGVVWIKKSVLTILQQAKKEPAWLALVQGFQI